MLVVAAALQWEARAVLRSLRRVEKRQLGATPIWIGQWPAGPVVVVRTGMGQARAEAAAASVLAAFPATAILVTGCAGGLDEELRCGDLVVADNVYDAGTTERRAVTEALQARLVQAARAAGLSASRGILLTVGAPILSVEEKRLARATHAACAVDMESAAVARTAETAGVAFACVRVILDDAATSLPPVDGLTREDGTVPPLRAALTLLARPSSLPQMIALAAAAQRAERSLESFFRRLRETREMAKPNRS